MSDESSTDCRSEEGITVGLIDSLISISRVLVPRLRAMKRPWPHSIVQALEDLGSDEDIAHILWEAEKAPLACTTERCFCSAPGDDEYYGDRAPQSELNAVMPIWSERLLAPHLLGPDVIVVEPGDSEGES